jgi:ribosomal protein S27E
MNFMCPHCEKKSIPAAHKLGATPATPAQCLLCGKLSSEPIGGRALSALFFGLIPLVVIFYALTVSMLWPVYLYFGLAIVGAVLWFMFVPLRPVTDEVHKREYMLRRGIWIAIGLFVALALLRGAFSD